MPVVSVTLGSIRPAAQKSPGTIARRGLRIGPGHPMPTHPLQAKVLAYLSSHHVMTLATSGPGGPWAAAVFYASERFDLYFLSAPSTRHAQDLAASPRAAATIQDDHRGWEDIRGVQLEGTAVPVVAQELARVQALYGAKYPFLAEGRAPPAVVAALATVRWWRLRPTSLYFVDNTVAFGHRDRVDLS